MNDKPKYRITVDEWGTETIRVDVQDTMYRRSVIHWMVSKPDFWDRVLRRSWEDKTITATKKAALWIKNTEEKQDLQKDIVGKFKTDLGRDL